MHGLWPEKEPFRKVCDSVENDYEIGVTAIHAHFRECKKIPCFLAFPLRVSLDLTSADCLDRVEPSVNCSSSGPLLLRRLQRELLGIPLAKSEAFYGDSAKTIFRDSAWKRRFCRRSAQDYAVATIAVVKVSKSIHQPMKGPS